MAGSRPAIEPSGATSSATLRACGWRGVGSVSGGATSWLTTQHICWRAGSGCSVELPAETMPAETIWKDEDCVTPISEAPFSPASWQGRSGAGMRTAAAGPAIAKASAIIASISRTMRNGFTRPAYASGEF